MIQFDEHIFQVGWFNHQPDKPWFVGPFGSGVPFSPPDPALGDETDHQGFEPSKVDEKSSTEPGSDKELPSFFFRIGTGYRCIFRYPI